MMDYMKIIYEAIVKEKEGKPLEDGDRFIFQLNDCVASVSYEDDTVTLFFVEGKPIPIDASTGMYE